MSGFYSKRVVLSNGRGWISIFLDGRVKVASRKQLWEIADTGSHTAHKNAVSAFADVESLLADVEDRVEQLLTGLLDFIEDEQ